MAFGKKKTLRVEFIEARNQALVGFDEIRMRDLPDNFDEDTWVEIDGDRWKVVGVEPTKLRTAQKEGALKVQVTLVEKRSPVVIEEEAEVLAPVEEVKEVPIYRNPSRADQMPRMSGKRGDLNLLEIATYEWRNIEFTIATNRSTAREVFAKLEELILLSSTERDGRTFYTRQYDRYDMFAPMRGIRLPLETVITDYFPMARSVDGLTFMGADQVADSTFVFRVGSGIAFYGQEFDDIIRYFAIVRPDTLVPTALQEDAAKIAALMKRKELILVDWQRRQIIEAQEEAIYEYFLQGFADHAVATARGHVEQPSIHKVELAKPVAQVPIPEQVLPANLIEERPIDATPKVESIAPAITQISPETTITSNVEERIAAAMDAPSLAANIALTPMDAHQELTAVLSTLEAQTPIEAAVAPEEFPIAPEEPLVPEEPTPEELPELPDEPLVPEEPTPEELPELPEEPLVPEEPTPEELPELPEEPSYPEVPMPEEMPENPESAKDAAHSQLSAAARNLEAPLLEIGVIEEPHTAPIAPQVSHQIKLEIVNDDHVDDEPPRLSADGLDFSPMSPSVQE